MYALHTVGPRNVACSDWPCLDQWRATAPNPTLFAPILTPTLNRNCALTRPPASCPVPRAQCPPSQGPLPLLRVALVHGGSSRCNATATDLSQDDQMAAEGACPDSPQATLSILDASGRLCSACSESHPAEDDPDRAFKYGVAVCSFPTVRAPPPYGWLSLERDGHTRGSGYEGTAMDLYKDRGSGCAECPRSSPPTFRSWPPAPPPPSPATATIRCLLGFDLH